MKRAFTLIELLVVIAIIAILAAILFPVFAQAKSAAKKTVGISNTKQAVTGAALYSGDVDGYHLLANSGGPVNCWGCGTGGDTVPYQQMLPYVKNTAISVDAMDPVGEKARVEEHLREYFGVTYAQATPEQRAYALGARSNLGYNYSYFSPWYYKEDRTYYGSGSTSETEVADPSNTLMFGTSIWDRNAGGGPKGGGNWVIEAPCTLDQAGNIKQPARRYESPGSTKLFNYGNGWSNDANTWNVYGGLWPFYGQSQVQGFPGLMDGQVIIGYADSHVKSRPVLATTQGCDAWTTGYQQGKVQDTTKYMWDFE